jgi:hypothetical protein
VHPCQKSALKFSNYYYFSWCLLKCNLSSFLDINTCYYCNFQKISFVWHIV